MNDYWSEFIGSTKDNSPRLLYLEAIGHVTEGSSCLDIAAGALVDTKDMLDRGHSVVAFDASDEFMALAGKIDSDNFTAVQSTMEDFDYGIERFDYINAMFALPFIDSERFGDVFEKIVNSLRIGGVFAFHLFGEGVSAVWGAPVVTHNLDSINSLISGLEVINLIEIPRSNVGVSDTGVNYQVIVKKSKSL